MKQLWDFLLNPSPEQELSNFSTKLTRFLIVLGVNVAAVAIAVGIQYYFKNLGLIDVDILPVIGKTNFFELLIWLLSTIFIIPIIEEVAFRLHLLPGRRNIKISAVVFIIYVVMQLVYMTKSTFTFNVACYLVAAVLIGCVVFQQRILEGVKELWNTKFRSVFYITALVFGGIHIINHRLSVANLIFAPLIVAPQIILGLNAGYLRVKSGFKWGLLLHILHNFLFVGLLFYLMNPNLFDLNKNAFIIDYPSTSNPPKAYLLTINDGKESILNSFKITPDEISFENAKMKYVFTQLANANHAKVIFEDQAIENKIINLKFISKSEEKSNLKNNRHFIIEELFKKYNLKAKLYIIPEGYWLLTQRAGLSQPLPNALTLGQHEENKGLITMQDATVKELAGRIETLYSLNCVALTSDQHKYKFEIPKNNAVALQKILLEKYGFEFQEIKTKTDYFYISSRND